MSFLAVNKYKFSLLYAFCTAISMVLIENAKNIPVATSLFLCAIAATIFFHLLNLKQLARVYKVTLQHGWLFLSTSVTIFIVWWCSFDATQVLGATKFIFTFFITRALSGYTFEIISQKKFFQLQNLTAVGLIILLFIIYFSFHSINKGDHLAFASACAAGFVAYWYGKSSTTLGLRAKLTATQILAMRFYLLLIVLAFFVNLNSVQQALIFHWKELSLITLLSFIIPLYFNQAGLLSAGPEAHAVIVASTPFFMVLLTLIYKHQLSITHLVISVLITILIMLQVHFIFRDRKSGGQNK